MIVRGAEVYYSDVNPERFNFSAESDASFDHIIDAIGQYCGAGLFDISDVKISMTPFENKVVEIRISKEGWDITR